MTCYQDVSEGFPYRQQLTPQTGRDMITITYTDKETGVMWSNITWLC